MIDNMPASGSQGKDHTRDVPDDTRVVIVERRGETFLFDGRFAEVHPDWLRCHERMDLEYRRSAGEIWRQRRVLLEEELLTFPVGVIRKGNSYQILRQVDLLDLASAAEIRSVPIRVLPRTLNVKRQVALDGFWGILLRGYRVSPNELFRSCRIAEENKAPFLPGKRRVTDEPTIAQQKIGILLRCGLGTINVAARRVKKGSGATESADS